MLVSCVWSVLCVSKPYRLLQDFKYPRPASLPPSAPPSDSEEEDDEPEHSSLVSPASELSSDIGKLNLKGN